MSDGPHKTLPMRANWKALLWSAYNPASSSREISEGIAPALSSDWRNEVTPTLVRALDRTLCGEAALFPDQTASDVQVLRARSNSPMDASFIDCALDALADGLSGPEAMILAIEGALETRILSAFRQIEEHVVREGAKGRAAKVRERLETALPNVSLQTLARQILDNSSRATVQAPKNDGLDDGVML
ncbi:hypothetical protein QFZ27_007589 [Inquilinus ginsengisoli]|uniref:hypothetical protein n=1 Tax=Inquilinus ginsengisoli TaxID=363840 RepID=UPI003D1AB356